MKKLQEDYSKLKQEASNLWEEKMTLLNKIKEYNPNDQILKQITSNSHFQKIENTQTTPPKQPPPQKTEKTYKQSKGIFSGLKRLAQNQRKSEVERILKKAEKLPKYMQPDTIINENSSIFERISYENKIDQLIKKYNRLKSKRLQSEEIQEPYTLKIKNPTKEDIKPAQVKFYTPQEEIDALKAIGDDSARYSNFLTPDYNIVNNTALIEKIRYHSENGLEITYPKKISKKRKQTTQWGYEKIIEFDYIDSNYNYTRRTVTVISKQKDRLYGYCHLRNQTRTFLYERIDGNITDIETGEVTSIYQWIST